MCLACIVMVCESSEFVHCHECLVLAGISFGCVKCDLQVRTVADTDRLAQASLTRPGEMCRGSPRPFCARGRLGDLGVFWASTQLAQARGISLKRDPAWSSCSCWALAWAEGELAWARLSRLSEIPQLGRGAERGSAVVDYLFILEWTILVGYECMMNNMYIMEYEVYVVWFLNYKWRVWHES